MIVSSICLQPENRACWLPLRFRCPRAVVISVRQRQKKEREREGERETEKKNKNNMEEYRYHN